MSDLGPDFLLALVPEPQREQLFRDLAANDVTKVRRLRLALEACASIEGDEERGWTVWIRAYDAPISCAGAPRRRRRDAEIDRTSLVNGLVLALMPLARS